MTVPPVEETQSRPTRWQRLVLTLVAAGFSTIFGIALYLKPDARGFGTHQQLGLPPCEFKTLTGLHCPHCGMTTSFSNVVRGRFDDAWNANPLGPLLAAMWAFCIPWCLLTALSGRWLGTQQPFQWFVFGSIGYLALALIVWVLRVLI